MKNCAFHTGRIWQAVFAVFKYFFAPNYFIFTHRRGWIHITEATPQDKKEVSGIMAGYL